MLKFDKLTKYYGSIKGVENLSLELHKGEIFGFIGPNGAGKSTTIKCIMNLINKNSGTITLDGKIICNNKEFNEIRERIGYLPSEVNLYDDLTVKEMLNYSASFYQKNCKKKIEYLSSKLKLDMNKKLDQLSFGNLKKVGIVLALMHDPDIIILDEATSGLDPLMQEEFYEILLEEKKHGKTIFFSSHILSEIKKICDRVGIIKDGSLIKVESIDKICEDNTVIVTITSKDIKAIKDSLEINVINENKHSIKFLYSGDIDSLLKKITKYKLDNLLIEQPSIEEVFMHYYK